MEQYYKIPAEIAESIGYFEYERGKAIDLLVGRQKDGTYLISETMYSEFINKYDNIKIYMHDTKKADALKNWKVPEIKISTEDAKSGLEETQKLGQQLNL